MPNVHKWHLGSHGTHTKHPTKYGESGNADAVSVPMEGFGNGVKGSCLDHADFRPFAHRVLSPEDSTAAGVETSKALVADDVTKADPAVAEDTSPVAARANKVAQYAAEYQLGGSNGDTDALASATDSVMKEDSDENTWYQAMAAYKNDGGRFDNAKLKDLLVSTGNQDLITDGVGEDDAKTIAAVGKAFKRGTLKLDQVFGKEGQDSGAILDRDKFDKAYSYITSGQFKKDYQDLNSGETKPVDAADDGAVETVKTSDTASPDSGSAGDAVTSPVGGDAAIDQPEVDDAVQAAASGPADETTSADEVKRTDTPVADAAQPETLESTADAAASPPSTVEELIQQIMQLFMAMFEKLLGTSSSANGTGSLTDALSDEDVSASSDLADADTASDVGATSGNAVTKNVTFG